MEQRDQTAGLRIGDFEFDPRTGELERGDCRVRLQCQPARVLSALLERPGELIARDELQRAVWGDQTHVDFDQSLNFCIRQIRKALGDTARRPVYIETLPRRGYRLVAPVARKAPRMNSAGRSSRRLRRRGMLAAGLATTLLSGTVLGHELSRSPLHAEAVAWVHRLAGVDSESCPWSAAAGGGSDSTRPDS